MFRCVVALAPRLLRLSRNLFTNFFILVGVSMSLYAAPTIHVTSPQPGFTEGSPVYYEADATSAGCAKGIAAIRIYTSPGVSAFTTQGSHMETFIKLGAGIHNTVVQAWDNCGAIAKVPVQVKVDTSTSGVSVFLPSGASDNTPIHVAASAQNSKCAISAMRLYTAPGVSTYTTNSDQLDTFVTLPPAKYNLVVQAWDKCGNTFRFPLFESVGTATSDRYLYTANNSTQSLSRFVINAGVLADPNGSGTPPQVPLSEVPRMMAADPSGHFVYALSDVHIFAFEVDRSTGNLFAVAGSPFAIKGSALSDVAMDPAGHYLYISCLGSHDIESYRIDRSTGALSLSATVTAGEAPPSGQSTSIFGPSSLTAERTGQLIYAAVVSDTFPNELRGYQVDANTGKLVEIGSPLEIGGSSIGPIMSSWRYVYLDFFTPVLDAVLDYQILGDGSVQLASTEPFSPQIALIQLADWFTRAAWAPASTGEDPGQIPDGSLVTYPIDASTGALGSSSQIAIGGHVVIDELQEDHSGKFLYAGAHDCSECGHTTNLPPGRVISWRLDAAGKPTMLSGPLPTGDTENPPNAIAVVR